MEPRFFERALITGITGSAGSYMAEYIVRNHENVSVHGIARWDNNTAHQNLAHIYDRVSVSDLKIAPQRIALPDVPTPTSPALTEFFYPGSHTIAEQIGEMMNIPIDTSPLKKQSFASHDVPGDWFKGPF